ncbi:MAG: OmpH family outer membrane protein [Dokdonella sp.]|nr:MAG: OmpH family outer membrane protein [Dokdonella sp.]
MRSDRRTIAGSVGLEDRPVVQSALTARRIRAACLWLLLTGLCSAWAQAPAGARIGYVDMKRLLDNAPQIVAGRSKLESEFAGRDAALKADEQQLAQLREKAGATPTTEQQRQIDALDRSIRRQRDTLRNELKTRSDQELDHSWREINDAVVAFAREQGYDLIVASPVVYASPRVDVTDKILDRLRRKPAKGGEP